MIARLGYWFLVASRTWWVVLTAIIAQVVITQTLFATEGRFTSITGLPVFDTQNDLTPGVLLRQLPLYTGTAAIAYAWFAVVDVVFPLVAAVFLCITWALLLRLNRSPLAQWLLEHHLPVLPLVVTIADWAENIAFITLIWLAPPDSPLATAAIVAKRLKLATLAVVSLGNGILLLLLISNIVARKWRRRGAYHQ